MSASMFLALLLLISSTLAFTKDSCTPTQPVLLHGFPKEIHLDQQVLDKANATLFAMFNSLGDIPCQSAAIVYGAGKLAEFHYGICNSTSGSRASGDTLYRIASLTKIFTDLAALRVSETTGTSLNTPVVKLEPRFKIPDPYPGGSQGSDITLELLGNNPT